MEEEIKMAIRKLAGKPQTQTLVCEVVRVDWGKRECHVKHDSGIELFHCRLRAVVEDNEQTGLCLKPKVNSLVTVQLIENQNTAAQVIGYSEVDAIELKMQDIELQIEAGKVKLKAKEIEFNGGNNYGLVLAEKLVEKINAIENKLSNHQHKYIPGTAGEAVTATAGTQEITPITKITDLENTDIKQ